MPSTTRPRPPALSLIDVRAGQLEASGTPRDWENGEVSTVERIAQTFGQEPANAIQWYFPRRLSVDVNGANKIGAAQLRGRDEPPRPTHRPA